MKLFNVEYFVFTECKNKLGDAYCDKYAKLGYCVGETFENMFVQCKRSCGFCCKYFSIRSLLSERFYRVIYLNK